MTPTDAAGTPANNNNNHVNRLNGRRLNVLILIIAVLTIVCMATMMRVQNLTVSRLMESVSKLSDAVRLLTLRQAPPAPTAGEAQIANPAAVNCVARGGQSEIRRRPDGDQYGVCVFAGGHQCEEWALFRGDCPAGGIEINGVWDEAETFCALSGGQPVRDALNGEARLCDFKSQVCPSRAFFETGSCE